MTDPTGHAFRADAFPAIVAHRGASSSRPENTIPSFEEAIRLGAGILEFDVRLERRLDDVRVGARPWHAHEHPDVPPLHEPEAARAAGDLGELPGQEIAALYPVELRRLREEQRLAREVDAVPEHVRGDADLRAPVEEAVDLLAARRERHRTVEDGDPVRLVMDRLDRLRGTRTRR